MQVEATSDSQTRIRDFFEGKYKTQNCENTPKLIFFSGFSGVLIGVLGDNLSSFQNPGGFFQSKFSFQKSKKNAAAHFLGMRMVASFCRGQKFFSQVRTPPCLVHKPKSSRLRNSACELPNRTEGQQSRYLRSMLPRWLWPCVVMYCYQLFQYPLRCRIWFGLALGPTGLAPPRHKARQPHTELNHLSERYVCPLAYYVLFHIE